MRKDEIDNQLKDALFEFFYWFSRFEFALKENNYLKNHKPGAKAEPSWKEFQENNQIQYIVSAEAKRLLELHPKLQLVTRNGELEWKKVGLSHCNNDLCRVITMLRTLRNNLFHGGKHGDADVDSKNRNLELLGCGKTLLDQMAQMAGFVNDYQRYY